MVMKQKAQSSLIIKDFKLPLRLGVTAKERAKKQVVLITIKIDFLGLPKASKTGKLSDAICYDGLTKKIKSYVRGKEFTLIEKVGFDLFSFIRKTLPEKCKLYFSVAKNKPLRDLSESIFEICD